MKRIEKYIKEQLFKIEIKSVFTESKGIGLKVPPFLIHKKMLIGSFSWFSFASTEFDFTAYDIWESDHLQKARDLQQNMYASKCPNQYWAILLYTILKFNNALIKLRIKK